MPSQCTFTVCHVLFVVLVSNANKIKNVKYATPNFHHPLANTHEGPHPPESHNHRMPKMKGSLQIQDGTSQHHVGGVKHADVSSHVFKVNSSVDLSPPGSPVMPNTPHHLKESALEIADAIIVKPQASATSGGQFTNGRCCQCTVKGKLEDGQAPIKVEGGDVSQGDKMYLWILNGFATRASCSKSFDSQEFKFLYQWNGTEEFDYNDAFDAYVPCPAGSEMQVKAGEHPMKLVREEYDTKGKTKQALKDADGKCKSMWEILYSVNDASEKGIGAGLSLGDLAQHEVRGRHKREQLLKKKEPLQLLIDASPYS